LGVIFDSRLNFRQHIQDKINKAYSRIGLIKRNVIHMDKHTFVMLYKSLEHTLNMLSQYDARIKRETLKTLKRSRKEQLN